jgi:hypothetical protein
MLFGEMYDAIHLKLSPQMEDEIPHHFFLANFGGFKNHVTVLGVD